MNKINLIADRVGLGECIHAALNSKWIGIDTEFLREKTYYPLLCLIQMSTESGEFCIDTLAIEDLTPLQEIFTDQKIVKIFHSCRQDLEVLDKRLVESFESLDDTQIAAAFCGYGEQISYAALVESICKVSLEKAHTRTDWSARPLSPDQLQYAIDDVIYLNDLNRVLKQKLSSLGRGNWYFEECKRVLNLKEYLISPDQAWKRLKGGAKIPPDNQQSAKALSVWREYKAQKSNRPREWVLPTRALVDICRHQPEDFVSLNNIESLNPGIARKSGREILQVLKDTIDSNSGEIIWKRHEAFNSEQRDQVKKIMTKLKRTSEEANIAQSILANRNDIEALVSGRKDIPLLEGWRFDFVGKEILDDII